MDKIDRYSLGVRENTVDREHLLRRPKGGAANPEWMGDTEQARPLGKNSHWILVKKSASRLSRMSRERLGGRVGGE